MHLHPGMSRASATFLARCPERSMGLSLSQRSCYWSTKSPPPGQQTRFGAASADWVTPDNRVFTADLRLQLQDSVHELLCRRWTTRHIHIDRDAVAAAHHR